MMDSESEREALEGGALEVPPGEMCDFDEDSDEGEEEVAKEPKECTIPRALPASLGTRRARQMLVQGPEGTNVRIAFPVPSAIAGEPQATVGG